MTKKGMFDASKSITLVTTNIVAKIARSGSPYLQLTQHGEKGLRKSCWFPDDWRAIKASMPKVDAIMGDSSCNLGTVKIRVSWNQELCVSVSPEIVLICFRTVNDGEIVKKFYISLSKNEWVCLCELEGYVDDLLSFRLKRSIKGSDLQLLQRRSTGNSREASPS